MESYDPLRFFSLCERVTRTKSVGWGRDEKNQRNKTGGRWEEVPKKYQKRPGEVGRKLNPERDLPTEILGVEIYI